MTVRHGLSDTAVPYRQIGSFKPGTGVGGAGSHWSGCHFRPLPEDLDLRSGLEQRFGKNFIPDNMTIQDFPVTYEELEPHLDHFEYVCGTSGKAGVLNGARSSAATRSKARARATIRCPRTAIISAPSYFTRRARRATTPIRFPPPTPRRLT